MAGSRKGLTDEKLAQLKKDAKPTERLKFGLAILITLIAVVLIFWGGSLAYKAVKDLGPKLNTHAITLPSWIQPVANVIGLEGSLNIESVVIFLAIVMMMFFALQEIIIGFTSFTLFTSTMIAIGLTLIAMVGKVVTAILTIFAFTAAISAAGIGVMVITGVVAAVVLNLGLGTNLKRWVFRRRMEQQAYAVDEGAEQTQDSILALRKVRDAFAAGNTGK